MAACAIAELADDCDPLFVIHMGLGLIIAVAALLRLLWGVVGSRYAMFASFSFAPGALLEYFRNALSRERTSSARDP